LNRPADRDVLLFVPERGIEPASGRIGCARIHDHSLSPPGATPVLGHSDQRPSYPAALSAPRHYQLTDIGVDFPCEVRPFARAHEAHYLTVAFGDECSTICVGEISQRLAHPVDHRTPHLLRIPPRRDAFLKSLRQLQ